MMIDSRHHSRTVKQLESNIWYAMYSDDYKTIKLRRLGYKDWLFVLRGDELWLCAQVVITLALVS